MKSRLEPVPSLPTSKCKRMVRPLVSKLHSLTGLYTKYPDKFHFDITSVPNEFCRPASARERLSQLKPFLSAEVFEAYLELFNIFRSIVTSLYPAGSGRGLPRLSLLAAHKVGKSIALGTKTSYFSLSQSILFDPTSIPRHLQKYHDTLADDIDDWLDMEPVALFSAHRPALVLGYVFHMVVLNLAELLFMLVPVLVHWLHEEKLPWLRRLFLEFWLALKRDPDHVDTYELALSKSTLEPNLDAFWFLERIGYWSHLTELLQISSSFSSLNEFLAYDALVLDAMGYTDRMDLEHVDVADVYSLLVRNPQYPFNTTILISVVAQFINTTRREYSQLRSATDALNLLGHTYSQLRQLVQTWLGLKSDCVFNSLDRGNEELFHALLLLLSFVEQKGKEIAEHRRESPLLCQKLHLLSLRTSYLNSSAQLLYAFFAEESLRVSGSIAKYLFELVRHYDEDMLITFMGWLHDEAPDFFNDFYEIASRKLCT